MDIIIMDNNGYTSIFLQFTFLKAHKVLCIAAV